MRNLMSMMLLDVQVLKYLFLNQATSNILRGLITNTCMLFKIILQFIRSYDIALNGEFSRAK